MAAASQVEDVTMKTDEFEKEEKFARAPWRAAKSCPPWRLPREQNCREQDRDVYNLPDQAWQNPGVWQGEKVSPCSDVLSLTTTTTASNAKKGKENTKQEEYTWKRCDITVDSGSAVSCLPSSFSDILPVDPVTDQRTYTSASGNQVAVKGQAKPTCTFQNGAERVTAFKIMETTKALGSVSQMCKAGGSVHFTPAGAWLVDAQGM
eukprot:6484214-Amphidinium_carterae.1